MFYLKMPISNCNKVWTVAWTTRIRPKEIYLVGKRRFGCIARGSTWCTTGQKEDVVWRAEKMPKLSRCSQVHSRRHGGGIETLLGECKLTQWTSRSENTNSGVTRVCQDGQGQEDWIQKVIAWWWSSCRVRGGIVLPIKTAVEWISGGAKYKEQQFGAMRIAQRQLRDCWGRSVDLRQLRRLGGTTFFGTQRRGTTLKLTAGRFHGQSGVWQRARNLLWPVWSNTLPHFVSWWMGDGKSDRWTVVENNMASVSPRWRGAITQMDKNMGQQMWTIRRTFLFRDAWRMVLSGNFVTIPSDTCILVLGWIGIVTKDKRPLFWWWWQIDGSLYKSTCENNGVASNLVNLLGSLLMLWVVLVEPLLPKFTSEQSTSYLRFQQTAKKVGPGHLRLGVKQPGNHRRTPQTARGATKSGQEACGKHVGNKRRRFHHRRQSWPGIPKEEDNHTVGKTLEFSQHCGPNTPWDLKKIPSGKLGATTNHSAETDCKCESCD